MKKEILNKISRGLIGVGSVHATSCCIGAGYYEPKISPMLLNQTKKNK